LESPFRALCRLPSSKSYETTGVNYISGAWSLKVSVEDNEKIKKYSVQENSKALVLLQHLPQEQAIR